jgi:uncharacterized protein
VKTITRHSPADLPTLSAFGYLLGLYAENYERLMRLIGDARNLSGSYEAQSDIAEPSLPTLYLDVIEQHRHTSILRLTHRFASARGAELDPSAWVRVYHDSMQAEVTHCHTARHLKTLFSTQVPVLRVGQRRHRMNVFFNKWLEHLIAAGIAPDRWQRTQAAERMPEYV